MTKQDLNALACEISALSVFRGIQEKKQMRALLEYLKNDGSLCEKMDRFGAFVYSLEEDDYCFSDFLRRAVYEDENRYIIGQAKRRELPVSLVENAKAELRLFSKLTQLSARALCDPMGYSGYSPEFENQAIDFEQVYAERLADIERYGYGIFASYKMFRVVDNAIVPVEAADTVSVDSFIGYEEERKKVFENTKALIEGRPAANVLLCGDAGTGKSSTVKACANYYSDQGIRLIELRKDQLFSLSYVMGKIADNPLKFIIFIDDLSFNKNDDCFSMLKAALEGSASAKAKNAD